jgi:hypothetical protein
VVDSARSVMASPDPSLSRLMAGNVRSSRPARDPPILQLLFSTGSKASVEEPLAPYHIECRLPVVNVFQAGFVESLLPNLTPARDSKRVKFRETLPHSEHGTFDELAAMIESPTQDLEWYHRVGRLAQSLRDHHSETGERGSNWIRRLAKALGPSDSVLMKASRFFQLYPDRKSLQAVEATGTDWTHLTLAFSVEDRRERLSLLREAVRNRRSPRELRNQLQRRYPTKRQGVGGRPRKEIRDLDTSGKLVEILRRTDEWLFFYNSTFAKVAQEMPTIEAMLMIVPRPRATNAGATA